MDSETLKTNLTSGRHWLRLLYMLLFVAVLYVAGMVMGLIVLLQFLFALITGAPNRNLRGFGDSLALYIDRILQFLTYSRDEKPFPFNDWPNRGRSVSGAEAVHTVAPGVHTVQPDEPPLSRR